MRKAIDIYGDKEYITNVTKDYVTFIFSDGERDKLKSRKADLIQVLEWYKNEMKFWDRMRAELRKRYNDTHTYLEETCKYYTEDEIKAVGRDFNAMYNMKSSNKELKTRYDKCFAVGEEATRASDKYWEYYKIARQIESAINAM